MSHFSLVLTLLSGAVCSIDTPLVRPSHEIVPVLAVATGQNRNVELPDDPLRDSAGPDSVRAHRFVVVEVGPGSALLQPGAEFEAVPWGYGPDCARAVWTSELWVPGGEEVVFLLGASRLLSIPIYDVLGWHSPYPTGEFFEFRARPRPPIDRSDWLSAREYFELVRRLPVSGNRFTFPDSAEAGIAVFEAGPPEWSSEFPGYEILRRYRGG